EGADPESITTIMNMDSRLAASRRPGITSSKNRSHRHLPMQHRRTRRKAFRRIDNGIRIDAIVAIEIADGASLAEMLDPERFPPVTAHAAGPAQRRRMAIEHGDDAAIARQWRQQLLDMAQMLHAAAVAAQLTRGGPAGMQPVNRGDCE